MDNPQIWVTQTVAASDVLSSLLWVSPLLLVGHSSKVEAHVKDDGGGSSGAG